MNQRTLFTRRGLVALALLASAGLAAAQDGPLRLVVPFTPGTGIYLIARTVGPKLSERLKRPVVVENTVDHSAPSFETRTSNSRA